MLETHNTGKDSLAELSPDSRGVGREASDFDASLLADSLAMTPWERMLANDDALNLAESLRTAMEKRHAKP